MRCIALRCIGLHCTASHCISVARSDRFEFLRRAPWPNEKRRLRLKPSPVRAERRRARHEGLIDTSRLIRRIIRTSRHEDRTRAPANRNSLAKDPTARSRENRSCKCRLRRSPLRPWAFRACGDCISGLGRRDASTQAVEDSRFFVFKPLWRVRASGFEGVRVLGSMGSGFRA